MFACLGAIELEAGIEVAFVLVVAAWWTASGEAGNAASTRRLAASGGITVPTGTRWRYAARVVCLFLGTPPYSAWPPSPAR
jgi:hypothetical protein